MGKTGQLKLTISTIMFTTGAALVILAVFSFFSNIEFDFGPHILQIFLGNIVITVGLSLLFKIEIRNLIQESLVNIIYIIIVLIVFRLIFGWNVPIWLLVSMAAVIYIFAMIILVNRIKKDTKEINELLQKRKEKDKKIAS